MFEVKTVIPVAKDLHIRIKDFDLMTSNDIIGETVIDLENRLLTQHGALVGLPQTYCTSGVCEWRNSRKPSQILEDFCTKNIGVSPVFRGSTVVTVGRHVFRLTDFGNKQFVVSIHSVSI
jgi:myoferlin